MDTNKPGHESFDQFIRRMYEGQRDTPFHINHEDSNFEALEQAIRLLEGITFHVNCNCNLQPAKLSIEDQLQRELAFDESRLVLKKIAGYDERMN